MRKFSITIIFLFLCLSACTLVNSTLIKGTDISNPPESSALPPQIITTSPNPTASLMPTATLDRYIRIERTYLSPDGRWAANFFGLDNLKLSVVNKQKNLTWVYVDENPQHYVETILHFISWSSDSRYMFFNQYVYFDGFYPYYDGEGLKRLDTKTGQVTDILSWNGMDAHHMKLDSMGVSPSGHKVVYRDYQNKQFFMVVRDIDSGIEDRLSVSSDSGAFIWSADENRILFLQYSGDDWDTFRTNILLYDLNNHEFQVLLSGEERIIRPRKWVDNNTILFYEWENNYYFLNINTGDLILQPNYQQTISLQ